MKPSKRFGFNSISSLVAMLDEIEEDCEKRAASYEHNSEISDRWINVADAIRNAAKVAREQMP